MALDGVVCANMPTHLVESYDARQSSQVELVFDKVLGDFSKVLVTSCGRLNEPSCYDNTYATHATSKTS